MESWRLLPVETGLILPGRVARRARSVAARRRSAIRNDGKLAALVALPPLRGLSDRELELVARAGDEVDLPAESVILMEGDNAEWVHLLMAGSAFAVRPNWRYRPGDWIGAVEGIAGEPGVSTVMAGTDVRILTLAVNRFRALTEEIPGLRRAVVVPLARQLAALVRHHALHHAGCDGAAPPLLQAS
jgi:CRP-like cAMP-binding protein